MTTKHTPAPWSCRNITMFGFDVESEDERICIYRNFYSDSNIDELKANAKLIAAAPDLLEILQRMADKDFEFSEYECILARQAIAKATQ